MSPIQIKKRPVPENITGLEGLPSSLINVLAARGLSQSSQLDYGLDKLLPPQGLSHLAEAAELICDAIIADAGIVIVGDFDVDGATSCAVAMRSLQSFGLANVAYLVPNRFEYGYGLSPEIVGVAALRQPDVIITVDNGISSVDGVHAAQQLGMSVIVTDHHLPGEQLPTAEVIVNPNLAEDRFASKNLAGVGVIFYVMLAVRARLRKLGWFAETGIVEPNMGQFLDLVALGTVADVVQLDRNNRVLVQQGIQRIRQGKACFGIQALLNVAKRSPERLSTSDLGFAVGPRLNAAGRLDDMSLGIECLLSQSMDSAMTLASQLDDLNRERRIVEQGMQQEAMVIVDKLSLDGETQPAIYTLYDESWHQGVVGLVASRIKERTQRPVLALAPSDQGGEWKGSARSVDGLHIRDMLARVDALHPNLMIKYGGHAMAAGLTLLEKNIGKFKAALENVALQLTEDRDWSQVVWTDGELTADEFSIDFADQLRQISPWGQAFPEPLFQGVFEVIDCRIVGNTHLKLQVCPVGNSEILDAICFGYLNTHSSLPEKQVQLVYRLDVNEFRGQLSLQLMVQHIRNTEP